MLLHTVQFGGYALDIWALLRIILGLWGIHYYNIFGKRLDAVFYQYKTRQLMSVFFVLGAVADIVLDAFGNMPAFLLLRSVGRLGVAFTAFAASKQTLESVPVAAAIAFPLTGVIQVAGMDIDVLSLASMALVFAAAWNFSIYSKTLKPSKIHDLSRKIFLLAVLSSYVFQFVGVLLGMDIGTIVELSETIAVAVGFYMVRAVVKSDENRLAIR